MKIAIPYQNGQVFPHFGHAPQFKFYTIESGMILHTEVVETAGSGHSAVTAFLMRGGVDTLICGSIGAGAQTAVALIGAVMVAGILTEGRGTPAVARALVRSFEQRCGATICKELKGVATGVPLCPCPECVRNAVLALGDVLPDAVKE